MPVTDSVTIILRAVDQATAALNQTRQQLEQYTQTKDRATGAGERFNRTAGETDRQTIRLNNVIDRLTSGSGLAATALTRVQGVLFSIPFGLVTGAAAGLTTALSLQVVKWLDLESAASRAQRALEEVARTGDQQVQRALLNIQTRIEDLDAFWSRVTSLSRFKLLAEVIRDLGVSASPTQINEEVIRRLEEKWRGLKAEFEAIRTAPVTIPEAIQRGRFAAQGFGGVAREIGEARASGNAERQDRLNAAIKAGGVVLIDYNAALERNADSMAAWARIQADAATQAFIARRILAEQAQTQGRTGQGFSEDVTRRPTEEIFAEFEARKTATAAAGARDRALLAQSEANQEVAVIGRRAEAIASIETQLAQDRAAAQALFSNAVRNAVAQAVLGQASLGKALKAGLAQTLATIAGEAAVRAIFETAMGFASLFVNPAKAASHFQAAAIFGLVGAAAGAAGRGFASGGGGGGGGAVPVSSVPPGARDITPSPSAQPLPQTINVYINGNLVDLSQLSRELRPFNIQLARDTI